VTGAAVGRTMIEIDGAGPAIVFVHGLGGTSNSFQALLGALGGFRCIRPDLPGSGRSPRPFGALTMDGFVESIAEVVRTVGGAPAHLVGHSMGTLVCLRLAAERPELVDGLTLFGPIVEPTDAARERLRDRARAARQDGMIGVAEAATAGGLASASRSANPLLAPLVRESHMRQDPEGFAQSCEALAEARGADPRLLRCPTLIVTGDEDAVAPPGAARALADKVRGARLRVLDHCGHWTPLERPLDCARLLSDHVRAREAV
jgi:3-oxoadipate enol-lactonase